MSGEWVERAPSMLRSPAGPDGSPMATPLDRRWLWHLETFLAASGTTATHRQMRADLYQYLTETCEHHWRESEHDGVIEAHRQCVWCAEVQWASGQPGSHTYPEVRP